MPNELNFEYTVLKHYLNKGTFARAGLIQQLIDDLRKLEEKEDYSSESQEYGLNDDEVVCLFQIAIIAHIMMFIEDLAVICKSISEGKIDYYSYLDRSGDDDLGGVVGKFYDDIKNTAEEKITKILSYVELNKFEFADSSEKIIVQQVMNKMINQAKIFFDKISFFRQNHIKIFRRYKHAGFPILLKQKIPTPEVYKGFEFASIGLTSKEKIGDELVPIPYSKKAIESYESIKNDIFSFLGEILHFKLICIERNVQGLIPNTSHTFKLELSEEEKNILDNVWKKFELKHPFSKDEKTEIKISTKTEILRWYTEIDNSLKRVL